MLGSSPADRVDPGAHDVKSFIDERKRGMDMELSLASPGKLAAVPGGQGASHAAVLLAAAVAALLFCLGGSVLNDPDTQWHIATARHFWSTGQIPQTDVFSYTFAGAPWIAKEWLSQLMLFAAFSAAGWWGVVFLTVSAISASIALLFGWLLRRVRPLFALAFTLVALCLGSPEFVARPHVLALPVIVLWTMQLISARERDRAPGWPVAGLMTLWANMHASYPLGLVVAGLLAAEGIAAACRDERWGLVLRWGSFGVLSLAAACVTPYGYKTAVVALALVQGDEATGFVSEWRPIGLDVQGFMAVGALAVAVVVLAKTPIRNAGRLVAVLLLGYMMIRHVRFTLLFGLLAPILIAGPLARAFPNASAQRVRLTHPGIAFCAVAAAALIAAGLARPSPSPLVTPIAALHFAQTRGLTGRVYNDYDFGGFLILNGVSTFIDGRNDQLFGGGFTHRLSAALSAPDNKAFAEILEGEHVAWALVKPRSDDARHLSSMAGWSKMFSDDDALVYAKECNGSPCAAS